MDLCPSSAFRSGVRSRTGRSQLLILGDSAAGLTSTVEYPDGEEVDNESLEEVGVPDDEALWRFVFERRLLRRPVTSRYTLSVPSLPSVIIRSSCLSLAGLGVLIPV